MADPTPDIELSLGDSGRVFRRWTSVDLEMRLDAAAHKFSFVHVDAWSQRTGTSAHEIADSINEGDRVRIRVNRKVVIDGYVDIVHLDDDDGFVQVAGRSATKDLIDCAAQHGSGSWKDATFATIAAEICEPFGVSVVAGDGTAGPDQVAQLKERANRPFRRVSIEPGETAFEFLNKLARERGLTLTATPDGELAYTVAGIRKIAGALEQGRNIRKGGRRTGDERERFSEYRIFGQAAGDDAWHGEEARGGEASELDDQVTRYRPFVAVHDGTASGTGFADRAKFERNWRAARGRTATAPVISWLDPEGNVWRPNRLIDVKWPRMRISGELLIEAVSLHYDLEGGDTGSVDLIHRAAYDLLYKPAPPKKGGGSKGVVKHLKKLAGNWIDRWQKGAA